MNTPNWAPFQICSGEERPPRTRPIHTVEGVGDRLRAAAFAEIQAREAFLWAAQEFKDASPDLVRAWRMLAREEEKHLGWLLARLEALGLHVTDRPVSDYLWKSFMACTDACGFAVFMANAEERGRAAGERFYTELQTRDPITAEIFRKIAEEEIAHIALTDRFFPGARTSAKLSS